MVANHRIANIPEEDPDVICLKVDHSSLLTTPSRGNRYINERLSLKSHLPGSVPHLSFHVRGKFCHLAQGGLVKRSDQQKIFEKLGPGNAPCLTTCTMRCMRMCPSAPWSTDLRDTCSILTN
ncbi:hypothetical protein TNCV_499071 [Trichonephila clavipes]|nr:hypothetical protein TNCV_499071 [Trichonephila clavipes]